MLIEKTYEAGIHRVRKESITRQDRCSGAKARVDLLELRGKDFFSASALVALYAR
jgi:hypothetical protein